MKFSYGNAHKKGGVIWRRRIRLGGYPVVSCVPDGGAAGRAQANRWKQWDAKPETKVHLCTMFVRLHRTNPPETAGHKAISRSTFLCDSLGCIWQTIGNDGTQNQRLKCLWRNARSVTGLFASEVFAKKGSLL